MNNNEPPSIILYHYNFSPYVWRITWYLTLRSIPYKQCIQPPILPRPDIALLGLKHRRIPIMAIGREIYYDTRLMLEKLEKYYPLGHSLNHPGDPNDTATSTKNNKALEEILEEWTMSQVFPQASLLIPTSTPLLQDPKFIKDREEYSGRSWKKEDLEKMRPEALIYIRGCFEYLEKKLFGDGREWILGTEKVGLADVKTIWPFQFLVSLPNALPATYISPSQFPKVFGWLERFRSAISTAKSLTSSQKPITITGFEALLEITSSPWHPGHELHLGHELHVDKVHPHTEFHIDENDPLELKRGDKVELFPTDTGFKNRDVGVLVGLTPREVVIECCTISTSTSTTSTSPTNTTTTANGNGNKEEVVKIRVHAPRIGFRVRKIPDSSSSSSGSDDGGGAKL